MNKSVPYDDMFGQFAAIETGNCKEKHIYKIIGTTKSNSYYDVPIFEEKGNQLHDQIIPCIKVIHCGLAEDNIIKVALKDCEIFKPEDKPKI